MLAEQSISTGRYSACSVPLGRKGRIAASTRQLSSAICSQSSRFRRNRWKGELTRSSFSTDRHNTSEPTSSRGRLSFKK